MTSRVSVFNGGNRETGDDFWSVLTSLDKSSATTKISHISLTASKDSIILINSFHLKFGSFSCLSISQSLRQISEKYFRWHSQEYLFSKISVNCCQSIYSGLITKKNLKFLDKSIYFRPAFESYCFHGHA